MNAAWLLCAHSSKGTSCPDVRPLEYRLDLQMHLSYYQHLSCDKSSTALSFNAKLPVSTKYTRVNVHRSLVVFRMLKGFRKLNWCCVSALVVLSLVTLESSLGNGSQSIYSSIYLSFYLSIYISVSHSLEAVGHVGRHADGS